jgi:hypothetical protein
MVAKTELLYPWQQITMALLALAWLHVESRQTEMRRPSDVLRLVTVTKRVAA